MLNFLLLLSKLNFRQIFHLTIQFLTYKGFPIFLSLYPFFLFSHFIHLPFLENLIQLSPYLFILFTLIPIYSISIPLSFIINSIPPTLNELSHFLNLLYLHLNIHVLSRKKLSASLQLYSFLSNLNLSLNLSSKAPSIFLFLSVKLTHPLNHNSPIPKPSINIVKNPHSLNNL
jgi:hypothetical protein